MLIHCPECLTELNIPSDAVRVTCKKCRSRFEMRPDGGAVAHVELRAGQRLWLIASWHSKRPEKIAARDGAQ